MNTGKLIVSTPSVLGDFNFHRTVVVITSYKNSGSIGLILNKKMEYTLDDVMEGIEFKFPIFFGGPLEQDNLFYLHTLGSQIPNSFPISDSLYWNGDFNMIKKLLNKGELNENNIRFFLGYSGWEEGQLEEEIKEKSWEPIEIKSPKELIQMNTEEMWQVCMTALGGKYLLWSNSPDNPSLN
ncbi:MAG: transcriptional regulator [Flavobacteriaceae bacterium]|nr:transcriptional regulator [Flavobacteriaceae bacterium]